MIFKIILSQFLFCIYYILWIVIIGIIPCIASWDISLIKDNIFPWIQTNPTIGLRIVCLVLAFVTTCVLWMDLDSSPTERFMY